MAEIKLNIGGKERIACLGLALMERAVKFEQPEDNNVMNISNIRLIYHALAVECELNGEAPDFTLKDVYSWMENEGLDSDLIPRFQIAFYNNLAVITKDNQTSDTLKKVAEKIEGKLKPQVVATSKITSRGGKKK